MQNTTTVRYKRNVAHILGIVGVTAAILIAIPTLLSSNGILNSHQKSVTVKQAMDQPVYHEIARATDLLQEGKTDDAGTLLDRQRNEPLIIVAGGYADGVMASDSPTTLLMRLMMGIQEVAIAKSKQGMTEEALVWVSRLHSLAYQAEMTSNPSVDGLMMVHCLKGNAYRTEAAIWKEAHKESKAARAMAQAELFEKLWVSKIRPQISTIEPGNNISQNEIAAKEAKGDPWKIEDVVLRQMMRMMTATIRI